MFKNLLGFWKEKDFLQGVLDEFSNMLQDTKDMFKSVCDGILDAKSQKVTSLEAQLYSLDKKVNSIEKDIRKKIVEHLSIQQGADLPFSLVLMSVVKDAERIGDYAKNLLEVIKFKKDGWNEKIYAELFGDMRRQIEGMFDSTKKAFVESDRKIAENIWQIERGLVKKCDKIVEYLAKSDLNTNQAVCFALMARYFKRIAAHLTNIATSVILPVSELDFFDERQRIPSV